MSTALAKKDTVTEVCAVIAGDLKPKIRQALTVPAHADRFVRVALTAVQQNPALLEGRVHVGSLYNSVIKLAQMDLLPDGREAALVRFYDKKNSVNKIQAMPMIAGLRKVAAESGFAIEAFVVYKNDHFDFELGFTPTVTHKPPALDQDRGQPIGAYAVATGPDGRKYLDVMSHQEIERVRTVSRSKDIGPWADWWDEMARKTVARRLWKTLPLAGSERVTAVIEADNDTFDLTASPAAGLPTDIPLEEEVDGEVHDPDDEPAQETLA